MIFFSKVINKIFQQDIEADDMFIPSDIFGVTVKSAKNSNKITFLMVIFCFGFILLALRLFFVQVINGSSYRLLAENNRTRSRIISASRGVIHDRNGIVLVDNMPKFALYIDPSLLSSDKESRDVVLALGKNLAEHDSGTKKKIENLFVLNSYNTRPILLVDNLDHENALKLFVKIVGMQGMVMETVYKRSYEILSKSNLSFSHLLGYVGRITDKDFESDKYKKKWILDTVGRTGLEAQYDDVLTGKNGKEDREVDAYGRMARLIAVEESISGNDLRISIDSNLQNKAEQVLRSHMQRVTSKRGIVIVHNPNNGEILAMVSLPAFNSNDFIGGLSKEEYSALVNNPNKVFLNRAISGEYQPGSITKPILGLAALEENVIVATTTINSSGGISLGGRFFPDWKKGGHGRVDVMKSIAESVNSFYYIIGGGDYANQHLKNLGIDKVIQYYKLFGLGYNSGIDLSNEQAGFLPTPEWKMQSKQEKWYIGDTYNVSIGHGDVLVTPLQASIFAAAFANRGVVYKPQFIMQPGVEAQKIIIPMSAQNVDIVRKGMRDAVVYGTAKRLNTLPFAVAGKTGTAQTPGDKLPHSWFIGFAPYDKPEVVITVLVEEGGEGSSMAVPIAQEVLSEWNRIRSKPDVEKVSL